MEPLPEVGTKPLKVSVTEAPAVLDVAEAVAAAAVDEGVRVKAEELPTSLLATVIVGVYDVEVVTPLVLVIPSNTIV